MKQKSEITCYATCGSNQSFTFEEAKIQGRERQMVVAIALPLSLVLLQAILFQPTCSWIFQDIGLVSLADIHRLDPLSCS